MTRALLALALCAAAGAAMAGEPAISTTYAAPRPLGSDGNSGTKDCPVRTLMRAFQLTLLPGQVIPQGVLIGDEPATPDEPPTPGCGPKNGAPVS